MAPKTCARPTNKTQLFQLFANNPQNNPQAIRTQKIMHKVLKLLLTLDCRFCTTAKRVLSFPQKFVL
jgi:hypothetical protein